MFELFPQNLFKKKTIEKLKQATRKFVAGITILMSVFYGTLYYALITLASEDDNVPKPLVSQVFDPQKEPEKFFLESLVEHKSSKIKIKNTATPKTHTDIRYGASISNNNYWEFQLEGRKVFEPASIEINSKLYVPFRLVVASGSGDMEIELKSKKGIQKIVLQDGSFDYAIFEKQKKNFTKLADMKNVFQFSEFTPESIITQPTVESPLTTPEISATEAPIITVEPPPSESPIPPMFPDVSPEIMPTTLPEIIPEPLPQSFFNQLFDTANAAVQGFGSQTWQEVLLSGPVSTSWAIDNQLLTINKEGDFNLGTVSFSVWAKIKLGYENSRHINSWEYGVSRSDGLTLSGYVFILKYDAILAAAIKSKNENAGKLELTIEKDEDEPSQDIADIESELSETNEQQPDEVPIIDEVPIEEEPSVPASPSQSPEIIPAASPAETTTPAPETTSVVEEPTQTPSFEILPTPTEPMPEPSIEPVITPEPITTPEPVITPEPIPIPAAPSSNGASLVPEEREPAPTINPEEQPTSLNYLLNELLGIETARADEAPPTETAPMPDTAPTDNTAQEVEPPHLEDQPLSSESVEGNIENVFEPTLEPVPDPIIEATTEIINQITEGLTGFVESANISLPLLEAVADTGSAPITIFEEPITASIDLSEPPPVSLPLTAQIIDAISLLNPLPQTDALDFKLNFNFGLKDKNDITLDEKTGHLTALISLSVPDFAERDTLLKGDVPFGSSAEPTSFLDLRKLLGIQIVHADTTTEPQVNSTILATISDIGVVVYDDGIWVASGDGSKDTDFKIHFDPNYGGAIDRLYLGADFTANKVAKPQLSSGGLTLIEQNGLSQAETKSSNLEVLEQSKVRVVVRNIFSLGREGQPEVDIEERYAIYATGRIIKTVIYDKKKTGEEKWYLNAAKTSYDLPAGYDFNQLILNTKLEPNSKDLLLVWQDPSSLTSSSFEAGEIGDSYTTVVKLSRQPWTYTEHQMIDLMLEDLSVVDKTEIGERAADYRNPDKPEFTLGRFIQVNKRFNSYEMQSAKNQNRVIFKMDGSKTPRFQPVFEIHDWENPDLNAVKAALNQRSMMENRDYIVDFRNGDPGTGILVFHFLGTIRVNSEFSTDGFGVFDIDPEVAPGSGILAYGGGNTNVSTVTTNSGGNVLGAFASISASTFSPNWVVNRASPVGGSQASGSDNEHLVGALSGAGVLQMLRWDGTAWSLEWTENLVGSASLDTRAFDIAYESGGEAVVAWAKNKGTRGAVNDNDLEYRVWDGISWSASTSFNITNNTASISWIEMSSHPASGSNQNEIGLIYITGKNINYSTTNTSMGAVIWNGTTNTWGNEPTTILEQNGENTIMGGSKGAASFYEQSSGKFVVITNVGAGGNVNAIPVLATSSWDGSSWTATASYTTTSATGDGATVLVCSPLPTIDGVAKNKAICAAHDAASADVWGIIWRGGGQGLGNELADMDTTATAVAVGRVNVASGWLIDGSNRVGFMAWGTLDTTTVNFNGWDDGGAAWLFAGGNPGGTTFPTSTTGQENNYVFVSNPHQKNTGTLFLIDSSSDLFAYEASLSGTTISMSELNNGAAITKDMVSANGLHVGMAYDLFPNPTQNHYRWRNDDGTLATATAAANEDAQLTGLAQSTIKRLRVEISNEGTATKSYNFQLEFAKKNTSCAESGLSPGWRYREIHADSVTASDAFDIELSSNFANGDATADGDTVSLTNEDPTFVAGQGIESASSTSAITLNGNQFTEIEFALQANTNSQASTDYCFRITDGGASTSFTYQVYAEVQTGAVASSPTYNQDFSRFYVNANLLTPTDPWPTGGTDLAEKATMSAHFASIASGGIARVRTNMLVGTATLNAASQTFQFQYAEGLKCGAIAGGSWAAVGASTSNTIWRFGSNAGVTDGTTLASPVLLSNSTDGARATYQEGNPSAVNPNAVTSGQRMEHDWSLQNNGAVSGASYCFRIIRNSGTVLETYNSFPVIILGPSTNQVLRHGAFFSEGYEQGYYWSGI